MAGRQRAKPRRYQAHYPSRGDALRRENYARLWNRTEGYHYAQTKRSGYGESPRDCGRQDYTASLASLMPEREKQRYPQAERQKVLIALPQSY